MPKDPCHLPCLLSYYPLCLISSKQKFERAIIIQEKIKDIISKIDALKSKIYDYEKEKSNLAKEIEALDEKNTQVSNFIKENESKISSLRTSEDFKEKVYKAFEVEKEYLRIKKEFEENQKDIPVLTKEVSGMHPSQSPQSDGSSSDDVAVLFDPVEQFLSLGHEIIPFFRFAAGRPFVCGRSHAHAGVQ